MFHVELTVERRCGSGVRVSIGKKSITAYFGKKSSNKISMQPKINTTLDIESRDVLAQARAIFFKQMTLLV